jgi:hypothetical protein
LQRVMRGHAARRTFAKLRAYREWWQDPSEADMKHVIKVQACVRRWRVRSRKVGKPNTHPHVLARTRWTS